MRPFELATLRLQNLKDVQLAHYDELKPADDRCLTQLGGCAVVGPGGAPLYSWVDRGLCDVPDFEALLEAIDVPDEPAFDFSTPAPAAAPEPASPEPYSVRDYLSETLGAPKPPASQPKAPETKTPRRWGGAAAPKKPAVPIKAESPPAFPIKAETVKEAAAALRAKAPKAETVKEAAAALRARASKVAPKAETVKEAAAALKSNAARTAANNKARAVAPAAALQAQAAKAAAANKAKADAAKARRAVRRCARLQHGLLLVGYGLRRPPAPRATARSLVEPRAADALELVELDDAVAVRVDGGDELAALPQGPVRAHGRAEREAELERVQEPVAGRVVLVEDRLELRVFERA